MKTIFRRTITSLALLMMAITIIPAHVFASTTPQEMPVSCEAPNPDHQTGLRRHKGDGDVWTFQIKLEGGARFVKGPFWSYPGQNGSDPAWGIITNGADGDSSLGWSSPGETGEFQVRAKGKIACGDGGGGEPIDFSAGWDGNVEFNAEMKVKRSGTSEEDYSGSATVAVGGKSTSEHKADVMVIATDDDGNPMEDVTVDTPTIQNGEGTTSANDASISAVNATTDAEGKAYFTFTSSDILGSVSLEVDGGESSASASIDQQWTQLDNDEKSGDNEDHYSWIFDKYFDYDTPSNVTFVMSLNEKSPGAIGSIPITDHEIKFKTTEVSGWEWDPNAGEDWDEDGYPDGDYEYQNMQDYDTVAGEYGDLVPVVTASAGDPGKYTGQQTVYSNEDFLVDVVYFDAVDYSADDGQ